jgi:hypothetical protein
MRSLIQFPDLECPPRGNKLMRKKFNHRLVLLLVSGICFGAAIGCGNGDQADAAAAKRAEEAHGSVVLDHSPLRRTPNAPIARG